MEALLDNAGPLLHGLLTTLWIAAVSGVGALVLGVLVAAARVSPVPVLRGVAFGYVQLFLNVPLLALLVAAAAANDDIKVVGEPFTREPYGIGLPPEDQDFKDFVNTWLQTIEDDGSWAEIWEATLGTVSEGDAPTPPEIGSVPGS